MLSRTNPSIKVSPACDPEHLRLACEKIIAAVGGEPEATAPLSCRPYLSASGPPQPALEEHPIARL